MRDLQKLFFEVVGASTVVLRGVLGETGARASNNQQAYGVVFGFNSGN